MSQAGIDANREPIISLKGVNKTYHGPGGSFEALQGIDLRVNRGEFVAVVGKSGSGKSTLLNMLAGIDRPDAGEILMAGTAIHSLNEEQVAVWRGREVGVVFQFFQLLPTLTVAENIMLPMDFANAIPVRRRRARALALLEQVGVVEQANKFPATLSGGQQQRVAIARALANDPPIIVADEPTGNLDSQTSEVVLQRFRDLGSQGKTLVMVTHERDAAAWVNRTVTLVDGRIAADGERVPEADRRLSFEEVSYV